MPAWFQSENSTLGVIAPKAMLTLAPDKVLAGPKRKPRKRAKSKPRRDSPYLRQERRSVVTFDDSSQLPDGEFGLATSNDRINTNRNPGECRYALYLVFFGPGGPGCESMYS